MTGYDLKSLSPFDFECLVGDLLSAEFQISFERFSAGPDGGVDLRHVDGAESFIVQCKHFARSTPAALKSHLKNELPKIEKLKPSRYLVATSLALSPRQKDIIASMMSPWLRSTADIWTVSDINSLLRRHPSVEIANYKLFLTSTAVLTRVLNSSLYSRSDHNLSTLQTRAARYVPNPSYHRAQALLEKGNVCIVTGVPGIGKTTLAEMLAYGYIHKGYKYYSISADIDEAMGVFDPTVSQFFFYDDFLGITTRLDKLSKNEESRLDAFVRRVERSPKTKFVLTTRDYILEQALMNYEKLERIPFSRQQCVLEFSDYGLIERARILYNHLFFSQLPTEHRLAIAKERVYLDIVNHRNFNPRLIDDTIELAISSATVADDFSKAFLDVLDEPTALWKAPFERHIGADDQEFLLSLAFLPSEISVDDAETHHASLFPNASKREFHDRLRLLSKTFLKTSRRGAIATIAYHNPSVRDFCLTQISSDSNITSRLVLRTPFFDSVQRIWQLGFGDFGTKPIPAVFEGISHSANSFCIQIKRVFSSPNYRFNEPPFPVDTSTLSITADFLDSLFKLQTPDIVTRLTFALRVFHHLNHSDTTWISGQLATILSSKTTDKDSRMSLLAVLDRDDCSDAALYDSLKSAVLADLKIIEDHYDAQAVFVFSENFPELFVDELREELLDAVGDWATSALVRIEGADFDEYRSSFSEILNTIDDLQTIGLDSVSAGRLSQARRHVDNLSDALDSEGGESEFRVNPGSDDLDLVHSMFRTLK